MAVLIKIPVTSRKDTIHKYLKVLYQFHKMTDKEIEITTELIDTYSSFRDKYDKELADKLIFSVETKNEMRQRLGDMADPLFQNYLSNLRRKKVIVNKAIAPQYLPPTKDFKLVIEFNGQTDKGSSSNS